MGDDRAPVGVVRVTRAQKAAAQMKVRRTEANGRTASRALKAVANAKVNGRLSGTTTANAVK